MPSVSVVVIHAIVSSEKEGLPIEFAAIRKHGVELRKRRSAPDPAKRNNRLRADSGSVHPAD